VVFYSLPQHASFYAELVNMAQCSGDQHCCVHTLFSSYDFLRLKQIVGLERSKRMIKAKSKSFLFKVE
jgi:U3 small nucleolar RNA-associated protein 25